MKKSARSGVTFRGFLVILVLGGAIGAGLCYYWLTRDQAPPPDTAVEPERQQRQEDEQAPAQTSENYIERKLREWDLTPEEVKRDLATAGKIVREKGREFGDKVADASSDVTIIAKIKAKYTLDDRLQALKISVGCKDGHVTLSGTVASQELIGRAVVLALDTEGVLDVDASLKVEPKGDPI